MSLVGNLLLLVGFLCSVYEFGRKYQANGRFSVFKFLFFLQVKTDCQYMLLVGFLQYNEYNWSEK